MILNSKRLIIIFPTILKRGQVISNLEISFKMMSNKIMFNLKVLLMPPSIKEVSKIKVYSPLITKIVNIVNYNH